MELIKVENNELQLAEEASLRLKELYKFKAEFDVKMDELKNQMLEAMEANGIKAFENDFIKMTYVEATTRKSVDTKALKEQGLYDAFTKETPVKASVKLTWK